jgi:hypothetical protein
LFLVEAALEDKGIARRRIRRYAVEERPKVPGVRELWPSDQSSTHVNPVDVATDGSDAWINKLPLVSEADLRTIDVLFCDSVTYHAVKHPQRIRYQLLADESLQRIASAAKALARNAA